MPWLIVLTSSSGILSPLKVSKLRRMENLNFAEKANFTLRQTRWYLWERQTSRQTEKLLHGEFSWHESILLRSWQKLCKYFCLSEFSSPALDFSFFLPLFWNPANFPTTREVVCKLAKSKYFSKELEKTFPNSSSYSAAEGRLPCVILHKRLTWMVTLNAITPGKSFDA